MSTTFEQETMISFIKVSNLKSSFLHISTFDLKSSFSVNFKMSREQFPRGQNVGWNSGIKIITLIGREPWSSGYGRRLMSECRGFESWHQILEGHDIFTLICCKNCNDVCLKWPKIKRGRGWPIFKKIIANSVTLLRTCWQKGQNNEWYIFEQKTRTIAMKDWSLLKHLFSILLLHLPTT